MSAMEPTAETVSMAELAQRCAQAMWENDYASRGLGMKIEEIGPGYARLSMRVRQEMLNGHATCHGGFIFTLADSAFAFACNSANRVTVASAASVDFVAPARVDDLLMAIAEERTRSGRTGVYDVRVENQDGQLIALFRGKSYSLSGQLVAGLEAGGVIPEG